MEKYLSDILKLQVKIEKWSGTNELSRILTISREYYVLHIGAMQFGLVKEMTSPFFVPQYAKQRRMLEEIMGLPVILWRDAISIYQGNELINHRIPFVALNSHVYLPDLGVYFKDYNAGKKEIIEKITAASQYLLL